MPHTQLTFTSALRMPVAREVSRISLAVVLAVGAPLQTPAAQAPISASHLDQGIALTEARDLNADPRVVEIELTAILATVDVGGQRVTAWTYDGAIPGPLIRVNVGDRLIVHFRNALEAATTVHWHGLRVPVQMDGVPGFSQPEVKPGEMFTYDFTVPDAGLYWYHPHVMSAAQVGFGLYGALLVHDPSEMVGIADERVLVLSDIEIMPDGALGPPDSGGTTGMAFGREGNVLLVNGRNRPRLIARSGATERWRVVNAAKSRYFELALGSEERFTRIGGDGGLLEYPVDTPSLVLAPGERADVLLTPKAAPGETAAVTARLFDRGYGSVEARLPEDLMTLVMADTPAGSPVPRPRVSRTIEPLARDGALPVAIEFGVEQSQRDGTFKYTINGKGLDELRPVPATVGTTQIWTVTNQTPWSHPFHLHGFFFQVLDKNGQPVRPLEWKDTVSVPYKDSVTLVVRYDDRPGSWMFHCHILDHAEGGLMGSVVLTRPGEQTLPPVHVHTP